MSITREPDCLLSLQQQSAEMGKVAVTGTLGDMPDPGDQPCPTSEMNPVKLLKRCQQLTQWKCELQKRIDAVEVSVEDFSPELLTEENMMEVIRNLEKDVEKLRTLFRNKRLLLDRLHVADVMHDKMFEKSTESQLLCETLDHSTDLGSLIIQSQKEISDLEEQVMEVRKKRMQLAESTSTMLTQFATLKENRNRYLEESDNPRMKNLSKLLVKENDVTTVLHNVFQRLILASCVNWAEDPKLRELVPKLGKSPGHF